MAYYLGLDNGGTTTKAAIYDSFGNELAVVGMETKKIIPQPNFVERDMDEMWAANASVIRGVLKKSGIRAEDIACIACCGHGKGLYLVDAEGRPTRNGIISTDTRAWKYTEKWRSDGTEEKLFELTCQHILPSQPVSLLRWLKENEPEAIEKSKWIFMCKDYIRFCLTGKPMAEITDYSGANLVNLHTRSYDPSILKLLELEECMDKLPPLCRATDICGTVTQKAAEETGLAVGTPVAGGAFDIDACALAVSVLDDKHICMIAGTWSINEYVREEPVVDGSVLMNSLFCSDGKYLVEECSPTSAGNNDWFIQNLLQDYSKYAIGEGENLFDKLNSWVESVPDKEFCPIFLPFLMGSNVHPNAKGCFVGMSSFHKRQHLLRGVYEGIVFSHRYHFDKLKNTMKSAPQVIRLAGGAANSKKWVQMFADTMNLPVEVVSVHETGALGCAILAATAAGEYESLEQAAERMCTVKSAVYPIEENVPIYEKKYEAYLVAVNALNASWDRIGTIAEELAQL